MKHIEKIAVLALAAAAAVPAQNCRGLMFTTLRKEESSQFAPGSALNDVRPNDVNWVQPAAGAAYSSKAYLPYVSSNVVLGDHDVDADFDEAGQFDRLDAVMHPRDRAGAYIPLDKTRIFVSPARDEPTLTGGPFLSGDVGRIQPGGLVERFLTEDHVRRAFGITPNWPCNVDAIAFFKTPNGGDIYLSLEDDVTIDIVGFGPIAVEDGAILRIPAQGVTFVTSSYDGACIVDSVAANRGQIVLMEPDVDVYVTNSNIADAGGVQPGSVGDVDGLTSEWRGGFFRSQWSAGAAIPHLWISGETMTGGGIISTAAGGSIPPLNTVAMGSPAVTTGAQVGLSTPASAIGSLAGLALTRCRLSHLSLDTQNTTVTGPGFVRIEVGGAPVPPQLMIDLGANAAGSIDPHLPTPTQDFPALYPTSFGPVIPVGANQCGAFTLPISAAMHAALVGQNIEFQAWYVDASGPHLSNPMKIEFR